MRIFISWSGELSKTIAEIFRQWIPGVIQAAKPYYSPDDITKGTRWNSEISKELDVSRIGIICLTKDNLESPWIMFEAGALSKNIDKSKVVPLLFDIEPSDIQGPLVQFQAAKFSKKEMKKVIKMINSELGETELTSEVIDSVFEMWWPKLEEKIQIELNTPQKKKQDTRSERDILEEVLKLTREISLNKSKIKERERDYAIYPKIIHELYYTASRLGVLAAENGNSEVLEHTERLFMLLEDLTHSVDMPKEFLFDIRHNTRFLIEENRMAIATIKKNNEKSRIHRKETIKK